MKNKEITILLENKLTQLTKRIAAIEANFHKGRSHNFSEQATETENDDVLDEIHHEAKKELTSVKSALPYTTKCINCAL